MTDIDHRRWARFISLSLVERPASTQQDFRRRKAKSCQERSPSPHQLGVSAVATSDARDCARSKRWQRTREFSTMVFWTTHPRNVRLWKDFLSPTTNLLGLCCLLLLLSGGTTSVVLRHCGRVLIETNHSDPISNRSYWTWARIRSASPMISHFLHRPV